ncbi:hypothetical protein RI129_008169 [Pyrocoelia pectoralis]|uniref:Peptidase M14 domain-containing protein n=1 Tax=Pyrocoelia pectoralis TaxID=417401 RepID=A0AAN7ZFV0_9COLE
MNSTYLLQIQDYLNRLNDTHSKLVRVNNYGLSNENRNLTAIMISTGVSYRKPLIFIDAGIHAREWISPAQALYIIHQLVENPNATKYIRNVDWLIVPLVNPDGYEYTHTADRFWRKNRAKGRICRGVDLNRNFDFQWSQAGASDDECSSTYAGPSAFSEPESLALSKLIAENSYRIKLYISLHSAAQSILYPWGYTDGLPNNGRELHKLAALVSDTVFKLNGTEYRVGTFANILYLGSGTSCDWAYSVANVKLAYTIELRPSNITYRSRFEIPTKNIFSIVTEMFEGLKTMHFYVEHKNVYYEPFISKLKRWSLF